MLLKTKTRNKVIEPETKIMVKIKTKEYIWHKHKSGVWHKKHRQERQDDFKYAQLGEPFKCVN